MTIPKNWKIHQPNQELVKRIISEMNLSPILVQVLVNRGFTSAGDIHNFLKPSLKDMYDPFLLKDIDKAITRIKRAINEKERIFIYGDYDVDGITATALFYSFLKKKLKGNVSYRLPNRLEEGYGLSAKLIHEAKEKNVKLIITVDCGSSNTEEIKYASEQGIDVIVTDHHEIGEKLPPAVALVNPKQKGDLYPFKELSGVGVAFKVLYALAGKKMSPFLEECLDLVAIGTLADIVPLVDENRILVKKGLEILANTNKLGLRALMDLCGIKSDCITSEQITFYLAPRINAAGRLGEQYIAIKLLLTSDKEKAVELARKLNSLNLERQKIEDTILQSLMPSINMREGERIIVASSPDWHIGVLGIVASRIVKELNCPVFLIKEEGENSRGSARGVDGFSIFEALESCKNCLDKYGGHSLAGGFTLNKTQIDTFSSQLKSLINKYPIFPKPDLEIEGEARLKDLTLVLLKELLMLEPFGAGNPQPVFYTHGFDVTNLYRIGPGGKHIKLTVKQDQKQVEAIGYRMGRLENKQVEDIASLAYRIGIKRWNGLEEVEIIIKDIS